MMAAKVKALQQWCKVQCEGYRDVNIVNMTSSWKSGLAFCAMIHRYRPDLIDYDSLSKENVFQNNKLAFDVGQQLGIPALLDPEDMVAMTVPDKLCIVTYVSQYYNFFRNFKPAAPLKRHLSDDTSTAVQPKKPVLEKTATYDSSENQMQVEEKGKRNSLVAERKTLEDTCNVCKGKVFLMERHIEGNKLYHRHCLRNLQKEQSSTLRSATLTSKQDSIYLNEGLESMELEQNLDDQSSMTSAKDTSRSNFEGKNDVDVTGLGQTKKTGIKLASGKQEAHSAGMVNKLDDYHHDPVSRPVGTPRGGGGGGGAAAAAAYADRVTSSATVTSGKTENSLASVVSGTGKLSSASDREKTSGFHLKPNTDVTSSIDVKSSTVVESNSAVSSNANRLSDAVPSPKGGLVIAGEEKSKATVTEVSHSEGIPLGARVTYGVKETLDLTSAGFTSDSGVKSKAVVTSSATLATSNNTQTSYLGNVQSISDYSVQKRIGSTIEETPSITKTAEPRSSSHQSETPTSQLISASSLHPAVVPETRPNPSNETVISQSTDFHPGQFTHVPSRPTQMPSVVQTKSGFDSGRSHPDFEASSSSVVPQKPPRRSSIIIDTTSVKPCDSLTGVTPTVMATTLLSSCKSEAVVSGASINSQKPDASHIVQTESIQSTTKSSVPVSVNQYTSTPANLSTVSPQSPSVSTPVTCYAPTTVTHLVSTPVSHTMHSAFQTTSHSAVTMKNTTKDLLGTVSTATPVTLTKLSQSVKSPISHPVKTAPSRPAVPPSGISAQPTDRRSSRHFSSNSNLAVIANDSSVQPSAVLQQSCGSPTEPSSVSFSSVLPSTASSTVVMSRTEDSKITVQTNTETTSEQIFRKLQLSGVTSEVCVHPDPKRRSEHLPIPKRPTSIIASEDEDRNKQPSTKLENVSKQKPKLGEKVSNGRVFENVQVPVEDHSFQLQRKNSPKKDTLTGISSQTYLHMQDRSNKDLKMKQVHSNILISQSTVDVPEKTLKTQDGKRHIEVDDAYSKPIPSPRISLKQRNSDVINSNSTWYVELETSNASNKSDEVLESLDMSSKMKPISPKPLQRKVDNLQENVQHISPIPLPRSKSKKGNDIALVTSDSQLDQSLQSSDDSKFIVSASFQDKTTDESLSSRTSQKLSPPPRPKPPTAENVERARKKIMPDSQFTFDSQIFNFGPTVTADCQTNRQELSTRSSSVVSSHHQPIVKRKINAEDRLPAHHITEQLRLLDSKLKKLEKDGRMLENKIRSGTDESMDDEKNDLMGQWFEMINQKNELVRQESELIYRCRQQELEDKHEDLEFELRCLMNKPDNLKTASEKKREEALLQKILQTVNQRNNIVESMEEDRLRYIKEDEEIAQMLTSSRLK